MVRVALRLLICALPVFLPPAGDAETIAPQAFLKSGTQGPVWQTTKNAWPAMSGFDGFGFIGAGTCAAMRRQIIDNSNRIRFRTIQICN